MTQLRRVLFLALALLPLAIRAEFLVVQDAEDPENKEEIYIPSRFIDYGVLQQLRQQNPGFDSRDAKQLLGAR